jgi:mRNA interferase RelE/StbE
MNQSTYKVELRPAAAREIRKLDRSTQKKVVVAIERLATEPRPSGVKKLEGEDKLYRIKVGKDHRIVYRIEDNQLIVLVVAIGNRKDIYRSLMSGRGGL